MFQWISIIATVAGLVLAVPLYLAGRRRMQTAERESTTPAIRTLLWDRLLYGLVLFCGAGLTLTGLLLAGFVGQPMSGFKLMLHVALGGLFIVCLTAWVVWWAERSRSIPLGSPVAGALRLLFWWLAATGQRWPAASTATGRGWSR